MEKPAINEAMISAIRADDIAALESTFGRDVTRAAVDSKGQNLLFYAVRQKAHHAMAWLLDAGADPDCKNHFADTPLHIAAHLGDEAMLELLFRHVQEAEPRNKKRQTPVMFAALKGDFASVKTVLPHAKQLKHIDDEGHCPLMYAVRSKKIKVVDFFIERGATVHRLNHKKESPLHIACAYGLPTIVARLLEEEINPFLKNAYGQSALHYAVHSPMETVIDRLLDLGLDCREKDMFGESPFDRAEKQHDATAQMKFNRFENDPSRRDGAVSPALHRAVRAVRVEEALALLHETDDIHRKDAYGNTPLFYAMMNEDAYLTAVLLDAGAALTDIDRTGKNALFHALVQKNNTMLAHLDHKKKQALMTEDVRALLAIHGLME